MGKAGAFFVIAMAAALLPPSPAPAPSPSPSTCTVTTDIAELQERYGDSLQHACGPGIKAISITGDHERLVYSIQYEADWKGKSIARDVPHVEASTAARLSCSLLRSAYPATVCSYQVRDGAGRPVCDTEIQEDESGATVCVSVVGEDDLGEDGHPPTAIEEDEEKLVL